MKLKLCMLFAALAFWAPGWADSDRWKDNGNQTLTDAFTGLIWTKHDNLKRVDWEEDQAVLPVTQPRQRKLAPAK